MTNKLSLLVLSTLFLSTQAAHAAKHAKPQAEPADEEAQGKEEGGDNAFLKSMSWTLAGQKAKIGNLAEITVPEGTRFTGSEGTRKMLEAMQNPTNGSELGLNILIATELVESGDAEVVLLKPVAGPGRLQSLVCHDV